MSLKPSEALTAPSYTGLPVPLWAAASSGRRDSDCPYGLQPCFGQVLCWDPSRLRMGGAAGAYRVCCSVTQLCLTLWPPWTTTYHASPSFTVSWRLLKLMSIESVMPSNHFILCCPLLFLPSIFLSIRVFSNESAPHIRWPEYQGFSFLVWYTSTFIFFCCLCFRWVSNRKNDDQDHLFVSGGQ